MCERGECEGYGEGREGEWGRADGDLRMYEPYLRQLEETLARRGGHGCCGGRVVRERDVRNVGGEIGYEAPRR